MHFTSSIKAVLAFFEMTPGELVAEWKQLTADDKTEILEGLTTLGYTWDVAK